MRSEDAAFCVCAIGLLGVLLMAGSFFLDSSVMSEDKILKMVAKRKLQQLKQQIKMDGPAQEVGKFLGDKEAESLQYIEMMEKYSKEMEMYEDKIEEHAEDIVEMFRSGAVDMKDVEKHSDDIKQYLDEGGEIDPKGMEKYIQNIEK